VPGKDPTPEAGPQGAAGTGLGSSRWSGCSGSDDGTTTATVAQPPSWSRAGQQVVAVDWTAWPVAGGWNGAVADEPS
jgi:hypothetical protein